MSQYELNKRLSDAIINEDADLPMIEELLKQGADPLGSSDETDPQEHILGTVFCEASARSKLLAKLPQIVQLFYDYGMNIEARNILDDGNDINPLWCLYFIGEKGGWDTLKLMPDNGLDYHSAERLVDHIFTDVDICNGCEIENDFFLGSTICSIKEVLCIASYPQISEKSEYIRKCIELEKNEAENLKHFREWDGCEYHFDLSTCTNIPLGLQDATVTITDKATSKTLWVFRI